MSLTYAQARDEITKAFADAWGVTGLPVAYTDRPFTEPANGGAWARFAVQHNSGQQESIGGPLGGSRYVRGGLALVQIFAETGKGLSQADELAKVAADAFEGKSTPGGVWFRRVRMREVGPDRAWYQVNVTAEFVYDEAK